VLEQLGLARPERPQQHVAALARRRRGPAVLGPVHAAIREAQRGLGVQRVGGQPDDADGSVHAEALALLGERR
jgi:hypothetical protein